MGGPWKDNVPQNTQIASEFWVVLSRDIVCDERLGGLLKYYHRKAA
jgi:hypothetical protein